jgi:hypothetical protein
VYSSLIFTALGNDQQIRRHPIGSVGRIGRWSSYPVLSDFFWCIHRPIRFGSAAPCDSSDRIGWATILQIRPIASSEYNLIKHGGIRIFKSRIMNEIKGKGTDKFYEKSRFVIQGYGNDGKLFVLTQSLIIQRSSQRILLAITPALLRKGMFLWLRDVTQAYTQFESPLQRTILAELLEQMRNLHPKGTIMVVMRPFYGVAEAGAYWWFIYFKHYCERLEMETFIYDPCLLVIIAESGCFGLIGMQTNDILDLNNFTFAIRKSDEITFLAKDRQTLTEDELLIFNDYILTIDGPYLRLKRKNQGQKLEAATDRKTYIEQRARSAYIATTCQPMTSFDLSVAAQIPDPSKNNIAKLNRRIEWQKQNVDLGLSFVLIDLNIMKLYAMVDALFANNQDLSSQIGYIIVLGNEATEDEFFTVTGNIVH